ncbi:hypothetical protein LguiB_026007 [Lonicera macranthoides]
MKENEKSIGSFQEKGKKTENEKWRLMMMPQLPQNIYIPQVIIDDILSRLPVISLLRFKSVCKLWHSTISSPSFYKREYELVLAMVMNDPSHLLYSIDDDKGTLVTFPVPWNVEDVSYWDIIVSNSCNGLILIGFGKSLFLLNPSTSHFAKVLELDYLIGADCRTLGLCGLCYDESIKEYKVIMGYSHNHRKYSDGFYAVAGLKEKLWTVISFPLKINYTYQGPVINGRVHWIVYDVVDDDAGGGRDDAGDKIIFFDQYLNVFEELPSPLRKCGCENAIVGLGILGGQLCMARKDNKIYLQGNIEVLVMKKYGKMESWTTMFVVSHLMVDCYAGGLTPLLVTKNGEFLLSINSKEIIAYNPTQESYRKFDIPVVGRWLFAVSLTQSKALLVDYEWDQKRLDYLES